MPNAFLDPACPIDWSHPLNRGLVCEWAVIPNAGWRGGLTLRDVVRGGHTPHDGPLTNGPTWAGAKGRPGGFGSLSFVAASSQYAEVQSAIVTGPPYTIACWFRADDVTVDQAPIAVGNSGDDNPFIVLNLRGAGAGHPVSLVHRDDTTTIVVLDTPTGVAAGVWYFAAITSSASNARAVYLYGPGVSTSATDTTSLGTTTLNRTSLGRLGRPSASNYFGGQLDGGMIFNRALPVGQVAALYDQSRRGNPDRWRWVTTRAWPVPATAPTGVKVRRTIHARTGSRGVAA
jgi:hypothetical protein